MAKKVNTNHSRLRTLCMVCSAARSGSTMLDLLLGGHSKAASLGEFSFLGKALSLQQPCTCGATVNDCPAWDHVFRHVKTTRNIDLRADPYALEEWYALASTVVDTNHQTTSFTLRQKLASAYSDLHFGGSILPALHTPLPSTLKRRCENAAFLYESVANTWSAEFGVDTLIDSSKIVHKAIALKSFMPGKLKIIFLTRDGRGVFHSRLSSGFSRQEAMQGWYRYNRRAQKLLPAHFDAQQLLRLKYEDLVGNQSATTQKICDFLALPFEDDMLTLHPQQAHLVNGNDMRLKGEQTISPDVRWRSDLAKADLDWFTHNDHGLNRQLGYE